MKEEKNTKKGDGILIYLKNCIKSKILSLIDNIFTNFFFDTSLNSKKESLTAMCLTIFQYFFL